MFARWSRDPSRNAIELASRIAATDRRHFSTVRPRHAVAFELVP